MGLGAFTDEQLAAAHWRAEDAGDFDKADEYEWEFFRRRRSRFADKPYEPDKALALWCSLVQAAQHANMNPNK